MCKSEALGIAEKAMPQNLSSISQLRVLGSRTPILMFCYPSWCALGVQNFFFCDLMLVQVFSKKI